MKKVIRILPFILIILIIPLYSYLDAKYFVNIFGCGCLGIDGKPNTLGNYFNANDLRKLVFTILAIIIIGIGVLISIRFKRISSKIIYIIFVALFNILIVHQILSTGGWK
ncbi:MAG TPA: hypothetical protein PK566_15495 [Pseudobacteroides sp.]|nr:hypothetical protein [Pseudobacteroides sp.]